LFHIYINSVLLYIHWPVGYIIAWNLGKEFLVSPSPFFLKKKKERKKALYIVTYPQAQFIQYMI